MKREDEQLTDMSGNKVFIPYTFETYKGGGEMPTHSEIIQWLENHPELDGYNEDGTPTDETYQDAIDEIMAERKGGSTTYQGGIVD